jgi:ABC-type nickel/cobalt efflux system permease component RcnA
MFLNLAIAAIAVLLSAAMVQAEPDINSSENDPFAQVTSLILLPGVGCFGQKSRLLYFTGLRL